MSNKSPDKAFKPLYNKNEDGDLRDFHKPPHESFMPKGFVKNNIGKIAGPVLFAIVILLSIAKWLNR
jgi:hypothetical protein